MPKPLKRPEKPKFSTYDCLVCITDLAEGTRLKKDKHKKYLSKMNKQGRVVEVIHNPKWRKTVPEEALKEVDTMDWKFRLANALLYMGDYSWWGWEFRSKWGYMCATNPQAIGLPCWNGQPGKVLLLGEQGIGDEIMFSSCIPDLQAYGTDITYICEDRLQTIFQRSFGIKTLPREVGKELSLIKRIKGDYDYYFPVGELPRLFRQSVDAFPGRPYLRPDPARVAEMEPYRGRIGISWRGRNGWYPKEVFPEGLSLQYDLRWDEDAEVPEVDVLNDLEGLLALLSVLEKVICVSTSVAHMAGAVGTPVDVVLAPIETRNPENMINWRWRGGRIRTSPWYNSARVYRSINEWKAQDESMKSVRRWKDAVHASAV